MFQKQKRLSLHLYANLQIKIQMQIPLIKFDISKM